MGVSISVGVYELNKKFIKKKFINFFKKRKKSH